MLNDYSNALKYNNKRISTIEALISRQGDNTLQKKLPGAYGTLEYYELLIGNFEGALKSASKGIALNASETWILTNKAHALLFLGRTDEARTIYQTIRSIKLNDKQTFSQAVLDDFKLFREKGFGIPAMDQIEKDLQQNN